MPLQQNDVRRVGENAGRWHALHMYASTEAKELAQDIGGIMTPWTAPEAYQPRTFVHPHVDAVIDEIRAIRREQELEQNDAPSGAVGWVVTMIAVFVMTFAIGAQALWEMAA